MIENRRWLDMLTHAVLILGVVIVAFPVWIAFVASTHPPGTFATGHMPLLPGGAAWDNYATVLGSGMRGAGSEPLWRMLVNSTIMAVLVTAGKIAISLTSAYAIVWFRFPLRVVCFWLIFITLMLPVEVRILPTFKVVADFGLLNSWVGLTLPLIASATATFLFRQFFMTLPDELVEAARIDGAGPMKFFRDILLPLSRTNIAALSVILFIYGWVQYLWPTLVTTDPKFYTVVMGIKRMVAVAEADPQWNFVMAAVVLAMLPPVLVVIFMQRLFVKGLIETEK
ncbi:sn-glycerol-3-phosphate ABC transporter permease UgpE [Gemmobacter sp.]|uniref:sn-glycerol-3-phosphate ABC transporter permease UgpE n=1 Tax=Gemmobacter sp. TaxID=1898957 RepID=UPI002AFE7B69|nr:sn-glycerol-3-phosphate ABC transporter permease UgpE [Gemmobacter sp.]